MNAIIGLIVLLIALFWSIITTVAGLLFLPIILMVYAIFGQPTPHSRPRSTPHSGSSPIVDYPYSAPVDTVPPHYYEAYNAYLKSPEWKALRKLVLKRDKYCCVDCRVRAYHKDICPTGERLQVHHLHYDGIQTMTFTTEQCVSVCKLCHEIRHGRQL